MNARRYSMVSYRSTARGSTVTFCTDVESITRTSGAVPTSMLAATSKRWRSSRSSSFRDLSSVSNASRSAFSSFSSRLRISALRASISCNRFRRFMFSHSLQVGLNDQPLTPLLSRLRGPALGLRLRLEPAPRADVGILVRRGIHRRNVPDTFEPQNAAGTSVSVVVIISHSEGKAHLVDVTALDKFVQIPSRRCVGQLRPHQQSLFVGDQLQRLVSGAGHDHDVDRVVVLERHVLEVCAL